MSNKKLYLILGMFAIIFTFFGGSLAYLEWQTSTEQQTAIAFTINNSFSCSVDGGGNITSTEKMLAPASCTNEKYAIQRTITANANISENNISVLMDLWLNVDSINTNLSNSQNFKYALTTNPSSCTEDVIESGTFTGTSATDTLPILNDEIYESSNTNTYYLYIWLDAAETDPSTMDQQFSLSLGGNCTSQENTPTFDDHTQMITSYTCKDADGNDVTVGDNPYFTYTGECEVVDDGEGDWRIRFLTDGTFTSTLNIPIDVFLVGGGGGGYTTTSFANIKSEQSYELFIGNGGSSGTDGEDTTGFGSIAFGGGAGTHKIGGHGGSGGGGISAAGGSDGSDGNGTGGTGQEATTREFGEETGDLYSGGGGGAVNGSGGIGGGGIGGSSGSGGGGGTANTGGGGGGGGYNTQGGNVGGYGGTGGSGIIVIRNTRIDTSDVCKLPTVAFDFTYTGEYTIINDSDGNWRIKFLTSGTLVSSKDIYIDVFLVGGGGGGAGGGTSGNHGGGGGGGYTTTTFANVKSGQSYSLTIGTGGSTGTDGEDTTGFNSIAFGGGAGKLKIGGHGGSGGGGISVAGGSDGNDGNGTGGAGQETTTREFGEETGDLYSGGGGGAVNGSGGTGGGGIGGYNAIRGGDAALGTGGGGGGGGYNIQGGNVGGDGGDGGSGIIVIRNTRIDTSYVSKLPTVAFDFTYTDGYCAIEHEGGENWKIKFLTSGTFTSYSTIQVDTFLVGGGGGGSSGGSDGNHGGGGGGGYTTTSLVSVNSGQPYSLVIGSGGSTGTDGEDTTGFGSIAFGGGAGTYKIGGQGGSGGGGISAAGGSDGSDGSDGSGTGGTGQETTTREFGEETGDLYSGGGGGAVNGSGGIGGGAIGGASGQFGGGGGDAALGIGGGGGGGGHNTQGGNVGGSGGSGGSGILIIRNART